MLGLGLGTGAFSGLVDWLLAGLFVGGGIVGSLVGTKAAKRLSGAGHFTSVFAILIFVVAAYMLWNSAGEAWVQRF